jgi:hypothetical protein
MEKMVVKVVENRVIGEGNYANDRGIIATTASNPYKSRSLKNESWSTSSVFDRKELIVA